ncbi:hypothetical protein [Polymorphospora rubra]|uniref:hypothetical protein n=1 Tax=Polymorphospora rubra TaxID=338584 RepID=UPI0033EB0C8B
MTMPPQQPPVPPAGWQPAPAGPPPGGWPPPPPVPVTKRIPEDQPFIVRASAGKRILQFGLLTLFVLAAPGCSLGLLAFTSGESALPILGILGALAVFMGLLFGLQVYLLVSGGPVLAVGPAGLWIKTRPTRGQAVWLPWEAIEQIYTRRWAFDKNVCVKPRDPRTGGNLGAFTAVDSGMQQLVFGTGFTAPLAFADRPEREIMGAIVHFSAGRTFIR